MVIYFWPILLFLRRIQLVSLRELLKTARLKLYSPLVANRSALEGVGIFFDWETLKLLIISVNFKEVLC